MLNKETMLNKEVLIMPTEHNQKAEIGLVEGVSNVKHILTNGKETTIKYLFINDTLIDGSLVKEVGDEIIIDDISHTIDDISVMQGQIILKNNDDNEKYIFEPTDIYYCEECNSLHFSDEPMVDDLDDEEISDDFILGHFAGYISGAKDMFDHYESEDGDFTVIDKAIDRMGLDFIHEVFDTERFDEELLAEFYNAISDVKEEQANYVDEDDIPLPQYTHEELVKLIGHDFNEA